MSTFVAQLPALIGVLIGTLGTILATSLTDRSRWRRSQGVRWDERRLDAYVEFARVVKEIQAVSMRVLAPGRPASRSWPIERQAGLDRLAEADVRHTLAWENVLLLGDARTVAAAQRWRDAIWQVERRARDETEPAEDLPELLRRANEGRDAFYLAARAGLGVRGGPVAQSALLSQRLDLAPAAAVPDRQE